MKKHSKRRACRTRSWETLVGLAAAVLSALEAEAKTPPAAPPRRVPQKPAPASTFGRGKRRIAL
jgi:hypothetical protein